jgi:moderate conductance mechanosensitive channel
MATRDQQNPGGATAMIPVAERPWASRRAFRSCAAAIILSATLMSWAAAAPHDGSGQETTTPPKIHELLTLLAEPKIHGLLSLLADPKVQEWLKEQAEAKAVTGSAQETDSSVEDYLDSRAGAIRDQIVALTRAIPDLPNQFERAAARYSAVHGEYGRAWALFNLIIFGALGFGAEWLFRKATERVHRHLDKHPVETVNDRLRVVAVRFALALGMVATFALGSVGAFLALDWDPTLRGTVLGYLIAAVVIRVAAALGHLLLAPDHEPFRIIPTDTVAARFWCRRLTAFVGWFALGWLIVQECRTLGFSFEARQLVGYMLGLGLLAIALESVWRGPIAPREVAEAPSAETYRFGRGARNAVLSIGIVLLWVLWATAPGLMSVTPGFWLVLVIMILPLAIHVTRRAVEHLLRPPGADDTTEGPPTVITVCLERGIRALLIIGAVAVLAWAWGVDFVYLAGRETLFARIAHGVLSAVIILLVADLLWQAIKAAIDRRLSQSAELGQPNTDEARRRARLRTLLPIFRNMLFVVVIAGGALMALAAMGFEIGPLIAGLSVVGVAVGFGAQTFVRDVIAGVFYLLDDAFRVGEYIQSGNYKGTVEGFSIRSVRLRHHRGPVYTVPFSVLGAIQNQSRDWVIDKMMVGITYDSDIERARKLIKQIGLELQQDPEFAPLILEPLKMQGVERFGDFAVQIRMKMMTLPGEQFVIRRKAYAMIKQAFDQNGIKFAFPTVQVAGEGEPAVGAAHRALELTQSAAA